jgi:flagellar assembly protein FliH
VVAVIRPFTYQMLDEAPAEAPAELAEARVEANEPVYTEAEVTTLLDQARTEALEEGFRQGHAEGLAEAKALIEADLAAVEGDIASRLPQLLSEADSLRETIQHEALTVCRSLIERLAPRLLAANGPSVVLDALTESLRAALGTSQIEVFVAPSLVAACNARIDRLARQTGYQGKIIVVADESLPPTRSTVHWGAGSSITDANRVVETALSTIDAALASMTTPTDKQ